MSRRRSIRTQDWIQPLGVALAALSLAGVLLAMEIGEATQSELLPLGAPPLVYVGVGLTVWRRALPSAQIKWAALAWALNLTLGLVLAGAVAVLRPLGLPEALGLVFGSWPVLAILTLAAPFMLPRPQAITRWQRAREPRESLGPRLSGREHRLVPPPPVLVGAQRTPVVAGSPPAPPLQESRATLAAQAEAPPAAEPATVALTADDAALPRDPTPEEPERAEHEGPIDSNPVEVDGEMPVRISFASIAAQLPADAFVLPPERLAASLREPHYLLIPLRLILPQLAEGSVEIAWALVDSQFPALGFAVEAPEFEERFPKLRLKLPMEEIVRQLPPGIFRVAAPATDLHSIESFPPPFQPFVTTMEPGASVASELAQFLAPPTPEAAQTSATPVPSAVQAAAAEEPTEREADPALEEARAHAHRMAARLAAAGSFEILARRVGGRPALAFVAPGLDTETVLDAAERVAPLLADARAETATLRLSGSVLVVADARVEGADTLVVAAVRPGAPLALLELLVARAVVADAEAVGTGSGAGAEEGSRGNAPAPSGTRLHPASADAESRLARLGAGLEGFGRVTPAAFVDGASGLNVYVFHADSVGARRLGTLASRVHTALADGNGPGALDSITFRRGEQRTVVRPVAGASSGVVAASGDVTRAARAGRAVERLAAALGAA